MSKGIELTPSQIKAFENGATMFIFPHIGTIKPVIYSDTICPKCVGVTALDCSICDGYGYIELPLQKGDKDVWIKEEFDIDTVVGYENGFPIEKIISVPASEMTKEQSIHSFKEVLDVRVVRVQDIKTKEMIKLDTMFNNSNYQAFFDNYYNTQLKEQNINRAYEDNDYVFLVEIKR